MYVFDLIDNKNSNAFVFDFQNNPSGTFQIYVYQNVNLNKGSASIINGGSASRIYTEVHGKGNGGYAFNLANGSSGGQHTKWLGTVWAPYAAINVGSGTGNSDVNGALWSATQVNIQSGATINYAPYQNCATPNANAGPDKELTCATTPLLLNGSSSTAGATFSWLASNGGNISLGANTATPTVTTAGTYTLTVTTASGGCTATDIALVTLNRTAPNANAGPDKVLTCTVSSIALSGSSTTLNATYIWVATLGGNIVSGGNTSTPLVDAAGTYTVTVTNSLNGCKATDVALVTLNNTKPNASAGPDVILSTLHMHTMFMV